MAHASSPKWRRALPTAAKWVDKRNQEKRKQLPAHLRPRPVWPIWIQILLNLAITYTLMHLMFNRDEYFTEAAPAFTLGICMFLLIYTIIQGMRFRTRYRGKPGARLAKINLWCLGFAFFCLPLTIARFLN
jgi:hypothetical protein